MLDNNERMNPMFCLIIVIVTILLIFITLYLCNKKDIIPEERETFSSTSPSSEEDSTKMIEYLLSIMEDPESYKSQHKYIEPIADIPFNKNLLLYGTTFSDKTHYDKDVDVYMPSMSRWNNFIKDGQHFTIINSGTTVPAKIKYPDGVQLYNTHLSGINADKLNEDGFDISQFTVTMILKVHNDFDFTIGEIELFSIALESPNYIKLTLENDVNDDNNVLLYSQVGDDNSENSKSGISIVKQLFINEISISMAYSKTGIHSKRYLFINGENQHTSEPYELINDLKLGNTNISINKHKNLNATLNMFMYHSIALIDDEKNTEIYNYYKSQQTMVPNITSFINTVTKEQLESIKTVINDTTLTQTKMKEELDKCITKSENIPPPKEEDFKYKVSGIGNVKISNEDIGSCPLLNIDKRITSLPRPSPSQPQPPSVPTNVPVSSHIFPFNIKLPF